MKFSPSGRAIDGLARRRAAEAGGSAVEPNDLLWALLSVPGVRSGTTALPFRPTPDQTAELAQVFGVVDSLFEDCGVNVDRLLRVVAESQHSRRDAPDRLEPSPATKAVLERALARANARGEEVSALDVLLSLTGVSADDKLAELFRDIYFPYRRVYEAGNRLATNLAAGGDLPGFWPPRRRGTGAGSVAAGSTTPLLDKIGRNLNQLAEQGKLPPLIGRKEEMRQLGQVLIRTGARSPVLLGEAGVGKTAVVEGFVQRVVDGGHPLVARLRVFEISMSSLMAGTELRGDLEERIRELIQEVASDPDIVLFIDELHTLVGAGQGGGGTGVDQLLKPALARGELRVIGATTIKEWSKHIVPDPALARRFEPIMVEEPTPAQATRILHGLRPRLEGNPHYGGIVRILDEAITAAVQLSVRFQPDMRLPDKAVRCLDEACACTVLSSLSAPTLGTDGAITVTIDRTHVAQVVSRRVGAPVGQMLQSQRERLLQLEGELLESVIGQDNAVCTVASAVRQGLATRSDDVEATRPIASFLFVGPTGVGKTFLARQLAEKLYGSPDNLLTLDMSGYQEKHSVARLIGAPPGYVGYGEDGELGAGVKRRPFSVVLFDEVDKAHSDVFDILLPVLDEGRFVDARGRKYDFSNTVMIFTSNLGATYEAPEAKIGFERRVTDAPTPEQAMLAAVHNTLRKELLGRLTATVVFRQLDQGAALAVLEHLLARECAGLPGAMRNLSLDQAVSRYLVARGMSQKLGARELRRTLQREVLEPLAELHLRGALDRWQGVRATMAADGIQFEPQD